MQAGIMTRKSPLPVEELGPSNTMLLGTTQVSLPNGISFHPTALAWCTSVTDIQMDRPRYGNNCHNMRNSFPRRRLKIHKTARLCSECTTY